MSDQPELLQQLLRSSSPDGLLNTIAALTHRMHATDEPTAKAELRDQRDLVKNEIIRRIHADPCVAPINAERCIAAQWHVVGTDHDIDHCPVVQGTS